MQDYKSKINSLPRVSFIIPTLNAEKMLEKCLKSIRNQKYPQSKIEIIISDGGSADNTIAISKKYDAKVIKNPEVLHEPGKTRAAKIATGKILFYTDSDNVLAHSNWVKLMIKPYVINSKISGFLPQTEPPTDSCSLNRYLGYLFTDPFTWFVYQNSANPKDYHKCYKPLIKTKDYEIFKFNKKLPLFGLSQGVGTLKNFNRGDAARSDDMLAGIKLIKEGGLIAYIPKAGVYHYHVNNLRDFIIKYKWRIRNNYFQKIKGMGFLNRRQFLTTERIVRQYMFIPYSFFFIFSFLDSIRLTYKYKDSVMLWHSIICFILAVLIAYETINFYFFKNEKLGAYE